MAITEVALFRPKNNQSANSPENEALRTNLLSVIKEQEAYSSYPVHLFVQVEDPTYIYLLGGWDSVETHMKKWVPSEKNQQLFASLRKDLNLVWLQHIDVEPARQSAPTDGNESEEGSAIPVTAPVIAIARHFVKPSAREEFEDTFSANKHLLQAFTKPKSVSGGWRLDPEKRDDKDVGNKDEFVLFSGWDAVEDHSKFADSDGFKDYAKILDFLEGTEVKHVTRLGSS